MKLATTPTATSCIILTIIHYVTVVAVAWQRSSLMKIDLIGVLKTVMHYGYSGISRETNLLSEKIDLYIDLYYSQETFLCSIPNTIP